MSERQITQALAAVLALQMFVLTLMVSMRRIGLGKAQGDVAKYPYQDGNDVHLQRRIRVFGSFVEYVPMCLILLGLLEYQGASDVLLWGFGGSFIVGRILFPQECLPIRIFRFLGFSAWLPPMQCSCFLLQCCCGDRKKFSRKCPKRARSRVKGVSVDVTDGNQLMR